MNIAILIPELSGGGAQRVAQTIGNYYTDKGYNVYYFVGDNNVKQDYLVKGNIVHTKIKSCMSDGGGEIQGIMKLFVSSIKMRLLKCKYKIDVAVSFMEEFNYINILSKGKEKVITRICSTLSIDEIFYRNSFLHRKRIISFFYPKADRVVVLSKFALKEMNNYYGVPEKKLIRIPNVVTSREKTCASEEDWQYGSKVVICVGRLHPMKQQERIIRSFYYAVQREPDAKLLILGKGSQLCFLENLCKRLNIDGNVVFAGFTDKVPYYLRHAKVFVMASKAEGFPNSMIEAMNYGVPVITTDSTGACSEIIGKQQGKKEDTGFEFCKFGILTPDMPDGKMKLNDELSVQEIILGEAILNVLSDEGIYQRYSRQSLRRASMYQIEKVIKRWDRIIES